MSKSKELQNTTELVRDILERNPKTRDSDDILYLAVLFAIGKRKGIDIRKMSIVHFFLHLLEYEFPPYRSVSRARQKLQAAYPELAGERKVKEMRQQKEEEFRDYAKGVV